METHLPVRNDHRSGHSHWCHNQLRRERACCRMLIDNLRRLAGGEVSASVERRELYPCLRFVGNDVLVR